MFCFQDAPHFTIDRKLKDILKVTPGACLQYAVIEGNRCLMQAKMIHICSLNVYAFFISYSLVCAYACTCRCSATSRRASDEPIPKRHCWSADKTQAGVERSFTHLVRTIQTESHNAELQAHNNLLYSSSATSRQLQNSCVRVLK